MMTAPKNGPTFQAFMRDCSVVLKRMDNSNNFNTHVVLDESKALTDLMYQHSKMNVAEEPSENNSETDDDDDSDNDSPNIDADGAANGDNNIDAGDDNQENGNSDDNENNNQDDENFQDAE
jgi:hypothetical protein